MNIKRFLSIVLCFIMIAGVFSLTGCGEDEYVRSELSYEKDKAMCLDALNSIALCMPGSAGSSIRTYSAAVKLLDWSHQSGLSEEDFSEILGEFLSTLGTGDLINIDKAAFAESFSSVDSTVRDIISGKISSQEVIDTIGSGPMFSSYELEVYELYSAIIADTIV